MEIQPSFSIIIPQYKTLEITRICLEALMKKARHSHEIIVIDNDSNDESLEYLKKLGGIKLIENKSGLIGGAAHKEALDIGVRTATRDWIVLLHSDTVFIKQGWDASLFELINENKDAVGFSSTARDINPYASWFQKIKRAWKENDESFYIDRAGTGKKIMSYCFGIRKDFLESIHYSFSDCAGDVATDLYQEHIRNKHGFILLGRKFLETILWHTSNTTSILTGQITDKSLVNKFKDKSNRLKSSIDD